MLYDYTITLKSQDRATKNYITCVKAESLTEVINKIKERIKRISNKHLSIKSIVRKSS